MSDQTIIIDGRRVADERLHQLKERLGDTAPGLGILVATDHPATATYVTEKERQGTEAGFRVAVRRLDADSSLQTITEACQVLNADPLIDAYIVQLPLPEGVDVDQALAAVDPAKDADGLSPANLERLYAGKPAVIPATPRGILTLLEEYGITIGGKTITVIGQGRLTGKPLSALLEQRRATVLRCDRQTTNLAEHTRQADILVVATGQPGLITGEMIQEGAIVIDVGITQLAGGITGDVDFDSVAPKAGAITPVPGCVGPMTVISLLENAESLAQSAG